MVAAGKFAMNSKTGLALLALLSSQVYTRRLHAAPFRATLKRQVQDLFPDLTYDPDRRMDGAPTQYNRLVAVIGHASHA
jgi:hypothetical protein